MKICKRLLSVLLVLTAALLYLPFTVQAHSFTDVNPYDDFSDAVNYLYDNNIMKGITSTTFEPNTMLNRAMFVTFLYRLAGEPQEFADINFTDVPSGRYFTDAVRWGVHSGIVLGTTETTFSPGASLQKQQIVTFLYRFAKYRGYTVPSSGTPTGAGANEVYNYAKTPMRWAQDNGIVDDCTGATLSLTRAETAMGLHRYTVNFEGLRKDEDIFSFANSSANFKYRNEYAISQEHYSLLESSMIGDDMGNVNNTLAAMANDGSCFGMTCCVILDKLWKIDFNGAFCRNCDTMHSVPTPNNLSTSNIWKLKRNSSSLTVSAVESAINYYQMAYYGAETISHELSEFYRISSGTSYAILKDVYYGQKTGGLGILSYHIKNTGLYHTIAIYGKPSESDENYIFHAYDNRFPTVDTKVIISKKFNNLEVVNGSKHEISDEATYFHDFDLFDAVDIDGPKNSGVTANFANAAAEEEITPNLLEQGYAVLYIDTYGDYSITNAEGETLSKVDGVYSGTMDAKLARMITLDTHAVYMLITHNSEEFRFETEQPSEFLGVVSETMNQAIRGQLDYVSMQPGNMEVCGSEIQYVVRMPEGEESDLRTLRFFCDDSMPIVLHFENNLILSDEEDDSLTVEITSASTGQVITKEFSQGSAASTASMNICLQTAMELGGASE